MGDTSPYPYFYPDTEVLVYTGDGKTGWQPIPFGAVPWGVEFLFEGRLYDVDPQGRVRVNLSVEASETSLTEADRPFEPYKSRWPEPEDLVRFVDEDNLHLFHNRAGTCQVGDRFWFQGVLYRCVADPSDPSSLIVESTYHVLNGDGRVMPVEEFALVRGDSLDEVYGSQLASVGFVGGTADSSGILRASLEGGTLPSDLGGQQPGNIQSGMSSGGGVGGMPTDFGFAGQRYDSSTGLIYMGARYYDPYLGRFISPDSIVQQRNDPQSYNRYAYARNNPLLYTDETGHCWGIASGLRNVPGYGVTCNNLDMALTIVQHPNTSLGQKAGAAVYIATEGTAHLALAAGGGMLAWEGGAAVVSAVGGTEAASAASTAATAACADGDCTNEIRAVSNVLCADGDCTNEISTLTQADLSAVQQFAQEAVEVNSARGMESFGSTWEWLSRSMLQLGNQSRMFIARAGGRITGMMQVKYTAEGYEIVQLEGLGQGAGTALFRQAIQDSIAQGYGGSVSLLPAEQAIGFYSQFPGYWTLDKTSPILDVDRGSI